MVVDLESEAEVFATWPFQLEMPGTEAGTLYIQNKYFTI